MTSRPRWMIWLTATVVLWTVWVAFAYLPLRQRDERSEAYRIEWTQRETEIDSRIRTSPDVMARIALLDVSVDSVTRALPSAWHLKDHMDMLTGLGREHGIRSIEASPELASMMSLTKSAEGPAALLDTLVVELNAVGDFHDIGVWLDLVETESSFRYWRLGRWDKGEEPGTVRFSGAAAFIVAIPRGESS